MFICQAPLCFQFTEKKNNWDSEKVYLVVCGCLLVVFSRLCLFAGGLWWFLVICWWFVVVCGGLWSSPVLLTKFLEPFLEFKCYHVLIYILIYIWVINDKIYFYCFLCVVVFTTEKKISTMSFGKISWLVHLRYGDITNMEIYLSWG